LTPGPEATAISILGRLSRGLHWINRLFVAVSMVAMLVAAGILTSSVATRYFFKLPTDWQDEASVFLLVGAIFLSGAYVQAHRGHIAIGLLAGFLPMRWNRLRTWLCDLLSLLFCSFFAWKSWTLWLEAWREGRTTDSTWAPPLWIPYGLMAVGMTVLALQLALQSAAYGLEEGESEGESL
jgi:TRAP-type C4-dicarboxylate transport system permease small subunit